MSSSSINNSWTFTPFPSLPATLLPNILFYNATTNSSLPNNNNNSPTYQISISYPFEWGPSPSTIPANITAQTMYLIDGNALGLTAAEALKRRKPVDASQPDTVVVSIGYPLSDAVYDLARRRVDFRPPLPPDGRTVDENGEVSGADAFLEFIVGEEGVRSWLRGGGVFGEGKVEWQRDALYGHSFGGLFVVYTLIELAEKGVFDTFLVGSPALDWNNGSILTSVTERFGDGMGTEGSGSIEGMTVSMRSNGTEGDDGGRNKPAVFIGYGGLEQFPVRRRTETEAEFQARKNFIQPFGMAVRSHELCDRLKGSGKMRDVVLKEYAGQDHSGVAASVLADSIDLFLDW